MKYINTYREFLNENKNSIDEAKRSIADTVSDMLTDVYDSSLNYAKSKKAVLKEISDIEDTVKDIKDDLLSENNNMLNEASIDGVKFELAPKKIIKKIGVGTKIVTASGAEYEITGYGQETNAFKIFDAIDPDGKKGQVKFTMMYGSRVSFDTGHEGTVYNWDKPSVKILDVKTFEV